MLRLKIVIGALMANSIIRISRGNENWGIVRQLQVYIDNARAGVVRWNETAEFEVSPTSHTVRFRMDWCQSADLPVDVSDGKPVELLVTIPTGLARWFGMIFAASRYFRLKQS